METKTLFADAAKAQAIAAKLNADDPEFNYVVCEAGRYVYIQVSDETGVLGTL